MSKPDKFDDENAYICFNCLISLSHVSNEENNKLRTSKYIMRKEHFSNFLVFRQINQSKFEYLNISDSLFFIRDIEECQSIYGNKSKDNEDLITSNETHFTKKDRLKQNTKFYLQHYISGKFVSCLMKAKDNKITLKLVNDVENTYPFSLEKINKSRQSKGTLKFNQIFFLNVYLKEDNTNYYVSEGEEELYNTKNDKNEINILDQLEDEIIDINNKKNNKSNYDEIILATKSNYGVHLINQSYIINDKINIYSGHLINIIFTKKKEEKNSEKEERMMLCLKDNRDNKFFNKDKNNIFENNNILDINNDNEDELNQNDFIVSVCPYTEELCDQVINNALWVVEDNTFYDKGLINIKPLNIEDNFRLRNALTGFYLDIRQKAKANILISKIYLNSEKYEYEFSLVDNKSIIENLFFPFNFKFFHPLINDENEYVVNGGKYILKGIFQNINKNEVFEKEVDQKKFYYIDVEKYYLSISLSFDYKIPPSNIKRSIMKNSLVISQKKLKGNILIIKNAEDDFLFSVKQIDVFKGSQVIYIQKIILKMEHDLKNNNININSVNEKILFLKEYLINIDFSFKDKNQEKNVAIKERQKLLWKFNIINLLVSFIDYIIEHHSKNDILKKSLTIFLENVKGLFSYLSKGLEEIKVSIYVLALNKIIKLEEKLNQNYSKLVYFIFDLVHHSEILQTHLIGDSSLLKNYIKKYSFLSNMNIDIDSLITEKKILELIESNTNYLLSYQNLLILNKVQYRREYILADIKKHIEEIQFKTKNKINLENPNYLQILENYFHQIKDLIKDNVILIAKILSLPRNSLISATKYRNSLMYKSKKLSIKNTYTNNEKKGIDKKPSSLVNIQEESLSNQIVTKESNIIKEENKYDEMEIDSERMETLNRLITQESKEISNNTEKLKERISATLPKDTERKMLLEKSTFRSHSPENRKSIKASRRGLTNTITNFSINTKFDKDKDKENDKKDFNIFEEEKKMRVSYKDTLNKLAKIWSFVKWFSSCEIKEIAYILDDVLKDIINDKIEIQTKTLYCFINLNKKKDSIFLDKNLKIKNSARMCILYLFRLFNSLFRIPYSSLNEKISKKENIEAKEILVDMGENIDLDALSIQENEYNKVNYEENLERDKIIIDEILSMFYSTYQFYINQYVIFVHKLLKLLSNFLLNQETFESIETIKVCFMKSLDLLLSKVAFLNDNIVSFIYSRAKENPTILSGVFNYKQLIEHSLEIVINTVKKAKQNQSIKNFIVQEQVLIDYLYSMCKECDEIKCLYEKISIFKYTRDLIFSKQYDELKEDEFNEKVKIEFKKILKLIWEKKRIPILSLYEEYNNKTKSQLTEEQKKKLKTTNTGNSYEQIDFWENHFYRAFKVGEITKFTLKLLKLYEIDEFFGNIIFLEINSNDDFALEQVDLSLKKIRKLIPTITNIENQIVELKLKKNSSFDKKKISININNRKDNSREIVDFKQLYFSLNQIQSDSLDIFNYEIYDFKSKNQLYKMLLMENKSFYKKIDILGFIKNMIRALNYSEENTDINILGYVSNLLRIISKIISMHPFFYTIIKDNFEMYNSLIILSFQCITKYPINSVEFSVEFLFLEIIFRAANIFYYIIKNCSKDFKGIKEFMLKVFTEMKKILEIFKSEKNKYIYRILYLYCVCRILLYLYNDKTYDSSSYKSFYNEIFNQSGIFRFIMNDYNKKKTRLNSSESKMETIQEESQNINNLSEAGNKAKGNMFFDLNNFPEEMHPVKIEISNDSEKSKNSEEMKEELIDIKTEPSPRQNEENNNNNLVDDEQHEWYDEEELEILSFYESFLFIYSIYLNEKNSMVKKYDEENKEIEEPIEELSLDILLKKVKGLLTKKNSDINNSQQINDNTNNYSITVNNITTLTKNITIDSNKTKKETSFLDYNCLEENSSFQSEDYIKENVLEPQHLFIFAILQSIINFQHSSYNHSIEIPIKKSSHNYESLNESEYDDTQNESDVLFDKKSISDSIIFYYYDSSHIDIILLEKIMIEIELKINISNYCLQLADGGNEKVTPLLKELLQNLNFYNVMYKYQIKEYNLVNNLFVKNNLALLIKKIFTKFKKEDLNEISQMKYFSFKKMGEVYTSEQIKEENNTDHKNINFIEFLQYNDPINNDISDKINIFSFLESLIYIFPKYDEKTCLILYKIGFQLLYKKCSIINEKKNDDGEGIDINTHLIKIIEVMTMIFNRDDYKKLIIDQYVFSTMLLSLKELLTCVGENFSFFLKFFEKIKDFLNTFDFILEYLSSEFIEIVNYLKRPENLVDSNNFFIHKNKLTTNLDFFITLLNLIKKFEEKILTEKMVKFENAIIEKAIKLISQILEIEKEKSLEIIKILIDFLFKFIEGPNIENLNIVFSLGFFKLISYIITNIDYYKLFLNYVNKDNIHQMIDSYIQIECRILKIFIIYYNISFSPQNSIEEFDKLQIWYENNFKKIEKKLKKLFYMSEKEMEGRHYSINKMLLSIKEDDNDDYSKEELYKRVRKSVTSHKSSETKEMDTDNNDNNDNKEKKCELEKKAENKNNNDFCIIKFDIILIYYILFNYHKNLSDKERKFKLSDKSKNSLIIRVCLVFFKSIYSFVKFLCGAIGILIPFLIYFFKRFKPKNKKDVDYLQDLQDIEIKCENINELKMINFLSNFIKKVEVSIKNVIYKVYFPMIDKANTLSNYRKEYLIIDENDPVDFANYLLSQYDYINIRAKQNAKIDKWIGEIPIINYIFKNMYIFYILIIFAGLGSTFLILSSFNTFTSKFERECGRSIIYYRYAKENARIQCPRFVFSDAFDIYSVIVAIFVLIIIQCVIQGIIFLDYAIRTIFVESGIVKFNYKSELIKNEGYQANFKISKFNYFVHIILPTFFRCIFNFKTIYYLLSLFCLILGVIVHPFFNCVILLEFVNRIEVMQDIVKAMYKPGKNILIILLMFIVLEYFASFFAQSYFTLHFPNLTDTKNYFKIFLRLIDETFKQDGGIGTYLDKTLEPDYVPQELTKKYFNRFIFDLIFYLIVFSLIFQMFLSVIIDYFNATREKTGNFHETMETSCIVCGNEREKIEKNNPNDKMAFDKHITYCHNVFNYIYYLMYLQSNDDRDTIIDNGVWNLHLVKNLSYLPKNEFFKNIERQRREKYEKYKLIKKKDDN